MSAGTIWSGGLGYLNQDGTGSVLERESERKRERERDREQERES